MIQMLSRLALSGYLALAMLAGGSVRAIWPNAVLQLLAAALIIWAAVATPTTPISKAGRFLLAIACASLGLIILQLVPLPPGIWAELPGQNVLVRGYSMLGLPLPWRPVSLTPHATLASAFALLPPLAVLLAVLRLPQQENWLVGTVILGACANVLLGAFQVASGGSSATSAGYLYEISNDGAVGFFANSNHLGMMLVAGLTFAVALVSRSWFAERRRARVPMLVLSIGSVVVILAGLAINRSLAAVTLGAAAIFASGLLFPAGRKLRRLALVAGVLAFFAIIFLLAINPASAPLAGKGLSSFQIRWAIWVNTLDLIRQTFPFGTGLGSFSAFYPVTENPAVVDRFFVNHAHNDYLELVLEGGIAAIALILTFLGWWIALVARIWRSPLSSQLVKAATIASGAMLAHSIVDYPLRTAALGSVFALCLALMARGPAAQTGQTSARRPTRHVNIG